MDSTELGHTVTGGPAPQAPAPQAPAPRAHGARFFIFAAGAVTAALSLTALSVTVLPAGASARPAPRASAMVGVKAVKLPHLGKILEDQKGFPLYYDTADKPPSHFDCTHTCLSAWPALVLAKGQKKVQVGKGVTGIGILKDHSGAQVTWKGKPLYTFASDSPGNVTGNGLGNFKVVQLT